MIATFTSTSRKREMAEFMDSNGLFVIQTSDGPSSRYNSDASRYSDFDEEEELIPPGALFIIEKCIFNATKNKWEFQVKDFGS